MAGRARHALPAAIRQAWDLLRASNAAVASTLRQWVQREDRRAWSALQARHHRWGARRAPTANAILASEVLAEGHARHASQAHTRKPRATLSASRVRKAIPHRPKAQTRARAFCSAMRGHLGQMAGPASCALPANTNQTQGLLRVSSIAPRTPTRNLEARS